MDAASSLAPEPVRLHWQPACLASMKLKDSSPAVHWMGSPTFKCGSTKTDHHRHVSVKLQKAEIFPFKYSTK